MLILHSPCLIFLLSVKVYVYCPDVFTKLVNRVLVLV